MVRMSTDTQTRETLETKGDIRIEKYDSYQKATIFIDDDVYGTGSCLRYNNQLPIQEARVLVKRIIASQENGVATLCMENWSVHYNDFIDVYQPIAGYKARYMFWDNEDGFFDCWQTGFCRYKTRKEAVIEAKQWAADECLPCLV